MSTQGKVIVIGIDGADWKIINQLKSVLPNITYLVENGASAILKSTIPPFSPIAWNSIFTGMKPHNHGILGFVQPEKNSYQAKIINSTHRKAKALWNYCTEGDVKGMYLNIPFTFPPESVNGVLISGLGTPSNSSSYSYPKHYKNEILKKYKDFRVDYEEYKYSPNSQEFLNNAFKILEAETAVGEYFFNTTSDWDVFAIVFRLTDVLQHYYWHDIEMIKRAYRIIDTFIGKLLAKRREEDSVIIVSDHGFCRSEKCFCVNTWLEQKGYLSLQKKSTESSSLSYRAIKWLQKSFLRRFIMILLNKTALKKYITRIPLSGLNILSQIDEKSKAYFVPGSCTSITLNLKGRQPKGSVEPADYDSTLDTLIAELLEVRDGSGMQVVREVFRVRDLYGISDVNELVYDIVFLLNEGFIFRSHDEQGVVLRDIETGVTATHDENGIFIAQGAQIKKGNFKDGSVYNILPTLLTLLRLPVPEHIDGDVWKDILKEIQSDKTKIQNKQSKNKVTRGYAKADEAEIQKSLENLGYI